MKDYDKEEKIDFDFYYFRICIYSHQKNSRKRVVNRKNIKV